MLCCNPTTVEPGHFLLVTADEQTAGRGQRGTHWESSKGLNLTFNIGWKAPVAPLGPPHLLRRAQDKFGRGALLCREGAPCKRGGGIEASEGATWPAANEQFLISEITALAVLYAIEDTLSAHTSPSQVYPELVEGGGEARRCRVAIKWPNDIYIIKTTEESLSEATSPSQVYPELIEGGGEREGVVGAFKICGMLLEHQLEGRRIASSIAGIGINVNQSAFDTIADKDEGRGAPISLRQIVGHDISREAVLECFVRHFMHGIQLLEDGRYEEIERDFTMRLYRRTGWHRYRDGDGEFLAEFVGIAPSGTLTLRKSDGTLHSYAFKEVIYEME